MQNLKLLCQFALISHGVSLELTRLSQRNTNLRLLFNIYKTRKTLHRQLSTNLGPFPVFYFKYAFLWWHIKKFTNGYLKCLLKYRQTVHRITVKAIFWCQSGVISLNHNCKMAPGNKNAWSVINEICIFYIFIQLLQQLYQTYTTSNF